MKHVYYSSFTNTPKFGGQFATVKLGVKAVSETQVVVTHPHNPQQFLILGKEAGVETWHLDKPDIRVYLDDEFYGTGVLACFYSSVKLSPTAIRNAVGQVVARHPSNLGDTLSLELIK